MRQNSCHASKLIDGCPEINPDYSSKIGTNLKDFSSPKPGRGGMSCRPIRFSVHPTYCAYARWSRSDYRKPRPQGTTHTSYPYYGTSQVLVTHRPRNVNRFLLCIIGRSGVPVLVHARRDIVVETLYRKYLVRNRHFISDIY